ncbi:MAG: hypothetical protein LBU70_09785 [Chitinispirillales bacterium]|jgi:uncharacterized protein (TIGR02145 family)|nr:hypothetical protein [Chitinispirillales bacterium]
MIKKMCNIAALALTATIILCLTGCGGREQQAATSSGAVKLLESIIRGEMSKVRFEYDDRNRIVKMRYYEGVGFHTHTATITYSDDGSVKIADDVPFLAASFVRDGNTITVGSNVYPHETITVNRHGYIVKSERSGSGWSDIRTYDYQRDNLTKLTTNRVSDIEEFFVVEYEYDNKKSPFFHCNTPKWLLQFLFSDPSNNFGLNNNIVEAKSSNGLLQQYVFEYDSEEFPTKRTLIGENPEEILFTYRGDTENIFSETETGGEQAATAEQGQHGDNNLASGAFDGVITAQVENGDELNSIVSEVRVIFIPEDLGSIQRKNETQLTVIGKYSNGNFTLTLPETLPDLYTYQIGHYFLNDTPLVSDKLARIYRVDRVLAFGSGEQIGYFHKTESWGYFAVNFWYTDRDITITGMDTDGIYNYSISLKRGWNKIYAWASRGDDLGRWTTSTDGLDGEIPWRFRELEGRSLDTQSAAAAASIDGGTFTDPRDNQTYRTVRIGNLTWMAQNLNFTTDNSWCYDDNVSNCEKYGRLYTWNAAMTACPAGWRLPSDGEWSDLITTVGGEEEAIGKLKSKTGWAEYRDGSDEFGFSAMPGGNRLPDDGSFSNAGWTGYWWSATENDTVYAWSWYIDAEEGNVLRNTVNKARAVSVRCVQ